MSINPTLLELSATNISKKEIGNALHEHFTDIEMLIEGVAEDYHHLVLNGSAGMGKTEFTNDILNKYSPSYAKGNGLKPIKKTKKDCMERYFNNLKH